ncbi:MFS transporter [Nocardiopsis baichengensis]|uniref:MFS transporter n=1 Tax=Nocardiopsis baichengensis TaxID=280240 RepID=UPI00034C1CF9|nr:MFS transporter [Nocardiopsis baichengensis]
MSGKVRGDGGVRDTAPAPRRLTAALSLDTLFGSLGLFSVLPILGLLLADRTGGAGTGLVGAGLFSYTASAGLSATLAHRWIARLDYRTGMLGALLTTGLAFGLFPYAGEGWALCAVLALAGFGVSVHFLLSRVLVAEMVAGGVQRNRVFSVLLVAVNAASAVGPFAANLLYEAADPRLLMLAVALCYAAAAAALLPGLPRGRRPRPASGAWPVGRAVLARVVRSPRMRRVVLAAGLGTFVYAQFFSAFALYVGKEFASPAVSAALIAGPSLAVALAQTGVTAVANRALRSGAPPFLLLACANLIFGASMVTLGAGLPPLAGAVAAVAVFCCAEMVFGPMTNTAFAELPIESSMEAFNLRQLCWSCGEALGSFAGGTLFLALYLAGDGALYWQGLGAATLVATAALLVAGRGSPGP